MLLVSGAGLEFWPDPDLGERRSAVGEHRAESARLTTLRADREQHWHYRPEVRLEEFTKGRVP